MAGLLDIFGGGSGSADDPYADILTPAQRNQMQSQGLLAMAGAFAQAGMPSRLPVPFGSALGSAAAALGTGQEAGMKTAIENALAAQKVRDLRTTAEFRKNYLADINDPTSPLGRAIQAIIAPGGTAPPGTRPAGAPPSGAGAGGGAGTPAGAGDAGGLLSPNLSLGSDTEPDYFTRDLTPKAPGGLLNYPEPAGGMVAGGALARPQPFNANLGLETPTDQFRPPLPGSPDRGNLYPFKDLGVVPGGAGGGAPAAPGAGAAVGPVDQSGQPAPPGYEYRRLPNGKLGIRAIDEGVPTDSSRAAPTPVPEVTGVPGGTNGIDPRKRAALDAILGGMQTAQGGPAAGRLPQFAGPGAADAPAADAVPEGGGLLGVAPDLRAPIEANPFARQASPGDPRGVAPLIRQAMLRQGVDPNVALRVAQSEGLATFLGDQGKSGGAFQLYTGGGLGNEFQKQTGLDPLDPKNEAATIDWVAKNVNRTGWSPFHGAANVGIGPRTGLPGGDLPPDELIPSGPGAGGNRPPVMQAQYAAPGGGGGVPGMPQLAPPTQLAPPGVPGLPGAPAQGPGLPQAGAAGAADPRMNALLLELARRNAAAEVLGMGNPYGSLLTVLQGSPQYKAAVESATAAARIAQEEPSKMRTDAAKARLDFIQKLSDNALTLDKDNNVVDIPGMRNLMGKTAGEIEAAKQQATSQFQLTDARVIGPDGQPTITKMPIYEYIFRQQQGARNAAMGAKPQPGDIVSSPISGPPPEGFEYRMDPNGKLTAEPIPNTPAAQALQDRMRKQAVADQATQVARDVVVQNAGRVENLVQNSNLPVTGTFGPFLSRIPGTPGNDARVLLDTIKSRSTLDTLNALRAASPTGGALGSVSDQEDRLLGSAISSLDQSQTKEQFLFNLRRVKEYYIDAVHGPGTYSKLSDEPVLKVPAAGGIDKATYDSLPSGSTFTAPDGSRRIKP